MHTVTQMMQAPPQLFQMLWPQITMQIKQATGGLSLEELKPVESAPKCKCPALFLHAIDDTLIEMKHSQENFDAYGGEGKEISFFEGDHNSQRPDETMTETITYLKKYLLA